MRKDDMDWERQTLARARQAAADLLDAAVELRWYTTGDPLGAAVGHLEAVLKERGQLEQVVPRPRQRSRTIPSREVWDRDGWRCKHCGDHRNLTVDHIVPFSRGGSDELDNLQTLCGPCNSKKGARDG